MLPGTHPESPRFLKPRVRESSMARRRRAGLTRGSSCSNGTLGDPAAARKRNQAAASIAPAPAERKADQLDDEARVPALLDERPLGTGAVTPSASCWPRRWRPMSTRTARTPIVDLGPGTAPPSRTRWRPPASSRTARPRRFNPIRRLLKAASRAATIIQGDAYETSARRERARERRSWRRSRRCRCSRSPWSSAPRSFRAAHDLSHPGAPFAQFTYALVPPTPSTRASNTRDVPSQRIWRNLPPARVWVYRRPEA